MLLIYSLAASNSVKLRYEADDNDDNDNNNDDDDDTCSYTMPTHKVL